MRADNVLIISISLNLLLTTSAHLLLNENQLKKNRALADRSNDEIPIATPQYVITRSGYNYSNHNAISVDGYVTQLIRLINPLADKRKLKQPPVLLFHGGLTDSTSYIWASAIQHHPEQFPRTLKDNGPITSSNRSIAFMLANNGYDVWLISTRGSNEANYGRTNSSLGGIGNNIINPPQSKLLVNSINSSKNQYQVTPPNSYYHYSMDNLIEYEFGNQVLEVLNITGAKNATILAFSLSSIITLSKFGSDPKFVENYVHNYILLAPIVNNHPNKGSFLYWFLKNPCTKLGEDIGNYYVNNFITTQTMRNLYLALGKSKFIRYTFIKYICNTVVGNSDQYESFLELPVIGHLDRPTSFMEIKQMCQIDLASRLQRYDYGASRNLKIYGQPKPPKYDISNITVKNWLLISASKDNLAPQSSVEQVLETTRPKPYRHVEVIGYNHLDLLVGFDNDIQVNIPILDFVNTFNY